MDRQNIYEAWRFAGGNCQIVSEASGLTCEYVRQVITQVINKNEREDNRKQELQ